MCRSISIKFLTVIFKTRHDLRRHLNVDDITEDERIGFFVYLFEESLIGGILALNEFDI